MVDESIDHENDAICNVKCTCEFSFNNFAMEIEPIRLIIFRVIVKNESTRFFHGLHSYRP